MPKVALKKLAQRTDTYVSTLRRFLNSLEMTLELSVIDKNGARINLPKFLNGIYGNLDSDDSTTISRTKKTALASISETKKLGSLEKPAIKKTQPTQVSSRNKGA